MLSYLILSTPATKSDTHCCVKFKLVSLGEPFLSVVSLHIKVCDQSEVARLGSRHRTIIINYLSVAKLQ